jgi:hypothetical protein
MRHATVLLLMINITLLLMINITLLLMVKIAALTKEAAMRAPALQNSTCWTCLVPLHWQASNLSDSTASLRAVACLTASTCTFALFCAMFLLLNSPFQVQHLVRSRRFNCHRLVSSWHESPFLFWFPFILSLHHALAPLSLCLMRHLAQARMSRA